MHIIIDFLKHFEQKPQTKITKDQTVFPVLVLDSFLAEDSLGQGSLLGVSGLGEGLAFWRFLGWGYLVGFLFVLGFCSLFCCLIFFLVFPMVFL